MNDKRRKLGEYLRERRSVVKEGLEKLMSSKEVVKQGCVNEE